MVTVEVALAVPTLLVAGLLAAGAPALVGAGVACGDAAREAALMVARGIPVGEASDVARQLAPPDAAVAVASRGSAVAVTCEARVPIGPQPVGRLVVLPVSETAVARIEPGVRL